MNRNLKPSTSSAFCLSLVLSWAISNLADFSLKMLAINGLPLSVLPASV
jgi:hypothetical protein